MLKSLFRVAPLALLLFAGACDRLFCSNTNPQVVYFEPGPDNNPILFDVAVSGTKQLTASASLDPNETSCPSFLYDSAQRPDLFQFSSTNNAVATVSTTGSVTGVSAGQATIRVTSGGVTSINEVRITVK